MVEEDIAVDSRRSFNSNTSGGAAFCGVIHNSGRLAGFDDNGSKINNRNDDMGSNNSISGYGGARSSGYGGTRSNSYCSSRSSGYGGAKSSVSFGATGSAKSSARASTSAGAISNRHVSITDMII